MASDEDYSLSSSDNFDDYYDGDQSSFSYHEVTSLAERFEMGGEVRSLILPSLVTESHLHKLRRNYCIPKDIHMRVPNSGECIAQPLLGEVAFYLAMFLFGFRLPLHFFLQRFLALVQLAPAQIVPNGWSHLPL